VGNPDDSLHGFQELTSTGANTRKNSFGGKQKREREREKGRELI
jgi:hypothetical protein